MVGACNGSILIDFGSVAHRHGGEEPETAPVSEGVSPYHFPCESDGHDENVEYAPERLCKQSWHTLCP